MGERAAAGCGCNGIYFTEGPPRGVGRWPLRSREALATWERQKAGAAYGASPPVCALDREPAWKRNGFCCEACSHGNPCEGGACDVEKGAAGPSQQAAYEACLEMGGSDCGRLLGEGSGGGGGSGGGSGEEIGGRMDRETWDRMSVAERRAYLSELARTDTERTRLITSTVTGSFDRLVDYLRTRRDIRIAEINAGRDVAIARIRANADAERGWFDTNGGGGSSGSSGSSDSMGSGTMLLALAALAAVLLVRK